MAATRTVRTGLRTVGLRLMGVLGAQRPIAAQVTSAVGQRPREPTHLVGGSRPHDQHTLLGATWPANHPREGVVPACVGPGLPLLTGDRYLFAFVVLHKQNIYGTEFFVLLTYEQLKARIRTKRTQYQVTLSRGLTYPVGEFEVGPGPLAELTDE